MTRVFGWRSALAFGALGLVPWLPFMRGYQLGLAFDALVFGTVAMSLDLLMGRTGLVSFGHSAFLGLGAYATAVLLQEGVRSFWLCVLAALVVVGLYACVVSYFATSRRGVYFSLLTLVFAEVVYSVFFFTMTFGGSDGIQGLSPPLLIPGVPASVIEGAAAKYYVALVLLALAYGVCRTVADSQFGRVLVAIRENEDRARAVGHDTRRHKMVACLISALLTGLAGAIYPIRLYSATPDLMHWSVSGEAIVMVMIGGLGTLVGPIVGGAFFVVLQEEVSTYAPMLYRSWGLPAQMGAGLHFLIIGIVLVFIVLFMPAGFGGVFARARRAPAGRPASAVAASAE